MEAEKQTIGVFDAEMDKWAKSIPQYRELLRSLLPERFHSVCTVRQTSFESPMDPDFVKQSIHLYARYHEFKMWARRPYTLPNRKDSPLAPAATAMCTSSAVTCLNLVYKLKCQLGVDLIHYGVRLLIFGLRNPGTDELELFRVQFFRRLAPSSSTYLVSDP